MATSTEGVDTSSIRSPPLEPCSIQVERLRDDELLRQVVAASSASRQPGCPMPTIIIKLHIIIN